MHPQWRTLPMAVGGSEEKRHGIILAKNDLAKACGIKTGESLRDARRKCPQLLIVHPHYDEYVYYTEKIKDIYRRYTDRVESFGLDEAWIDLTHSQLLFGDGIELAKKIQDEVQETFGISVSMGVSFNKVFAKLASDLFKHKGFALITPENFREVVWQRPVEDLLMVGRRMQLHLNAMKIYTIGDLAQRDCLVLERRFGVMGALLWRYANGLDDEPVELCGITREPRSIGNSKTVVHDICSMEQLREVLRVLCESVAARLRNEKMRCLQVSVYLRDTDLKGRSMQMRLGQPSDLASDLLEAAMHLVCRMQLETVSLRSVGVQAGRLSADDGYDQPGLFERPDARKRQRAMEKTVHEIRLKYGYDACRMASSRLDEPLTDFDPMELLHQVHPIGVLKGPIQKR